MEFSCPACAAPHAFPDDQVPAGGIVVACTRCGAHITLTRAGVVGARPLQPEAPSVEPDPPAAQEATVGMMSPLADLPGAKAPEAPSPPKAEPPKAPSPPKAEPPKAPSPPSAEPKAEPPKADDDPSLARTAAEGSGLFKAAKKAMSAAKEKAEGAFDSAAREAIEPETKVPEGLAFPGFSPADGPWTWRDLPRAFAGVLDTRRVIFATAGFWAAFIVFGVLSWVGGLLGGLWGPLGTLFSVVAWLGFVGASALVASILGYVLYQTVIERKASSVKAGIAWTKAQLRSVVGTPLAFVVVIAGVWVVQFVVGMVGRIPFAGPIIWGAVSPITIALSLVAGAVGVVLIYSIPLYIPVIYNENTGPKETLQRLGALFRAHGFRLAAYLLLTVITIAFAFLVVIFPMITLATRVGLAGAEAGFGMENFIKVLAGMPAGMGLGLPMQGGGDVSFEYDLAGLLFGIGSAIGPAFILALVALVYYTAGAIMYCIVTGRSKETP